MISPRRRPAPGGRPGFVRAIAPDTLAFSSYDGNGMARPCELVAHEVAATPMPRLAGTYASSWRTGSIAASRANSSGMNGW